MPSLEARVQALRGLYVVTVLAAAGYLVFAQAPLPGLFVAAMGLLKARPWLSTHLAGRRALNGAWRSTTAGDLVVEVPSGWTVEESNEGRGVHLDGPGGFVQVIRWPNRETANDAAVQALLTGVSSKVRLRSPRVCEGAIGELPADGQRADVVTRSETAVVEVLAARTRDGELLTLLTYRDVGLPAALLRRCAASVRLVMARGQP